MTQTINTTSIINLSFLQSVKLHHLLFLWLLWLIYDYYSITIIYDYKTHLHQL